MTLRLHLLDGFNQDEVEIAVDGRTAFQAEKLSTSLLIGLAESVEVQVPGGHHVVEIRMPRRGLQESMALDINSDTTLLASADMGHIRLTKGTGREGFA
jgi:hypothetical protein